MNDTITTTTIYKDTHWAIQLMWQDFVLETVWEPIKGRRPQPETKQQAKCQQARYTALFERLAASTPKPTESMFFTLARLVQDPRARVNGNVLMALEKRGVIAYNEVTATWLPVFTDTDTAQ